MKNIVISLGGSIIIPDSNIDYKFLEKFKKTLENNYSKYKFTIVCGGGPIARKYIAALKKERKSMKELSLAGIRITRINALFMMQIFGKKANDFLPKNMKEIKNDLKKNKIVICGALRYSEKSTSDSTAAELAHYLNADFINMTNVNGLYSSDPKKNKDSKFISKIEWGKFENMANKIKYHAGQHFILDQNASKIIRKYKIKTYLIGKNTKNLNRLINNKKFLGTTIYND